MSSVLEEHYGYLALTGRHDLFNRAISRTIEPGHYVADIGCGFGVLGIQCLRAGAGHVVGIDRTDAIEIARETVRREGLAGQYTCIRASTFRAELPQLADAIICDHVGCFGVDYGIIAMVEDARKRLLKTGGAVIPKTICLQVAGVSSTKRGALANAWSRPPVPAEYAWLDEYAANSSYNVDLIRDEICSLPASLGTIPLDKDNPETLEFDAQIEITQTCELHGLAGWFECELADGVWMNNSPVSDDAIGRSQAFFPLAEPVTVKAGETISVSFRILHSQSIMSWIVEFSAGQTRQSMTSWKSTILTHTDLAVQTGAPLGPNPLGRARAALHSRLDGTRSAQQIESELMEVSPPLFPSHDELRRFVKAELSATSG